MALFLGLYAFFFLVMRFDLAGHHSPEHPRHPMSYGNAALWALLATIATFLYARWRESRQAENR